jgi:uncharacterized membrane protein
MENLRFEPVFDSYLLATILAILLFGSLVIHPSFRKLTRNRQRVLTACRCGAVLLIVLGLFRPVWVYRTDSRETPVVVFLLDVTRSMLLPDASGKGTRWEAQQDLLAKCRAATRRFDDFEFQYYAYDRQANDVSNGVYPKKPTGDSTDIGSSIYGVIRKQAGRRIAAVVLTGDGTQTELQPAVEFQIAERSVSRTGAPLLATGFGPSGGADQSRDVAVESLPEQYAVFVKNVLMVRGTVRVRGYANKEIMTKVVVRSANGKEKVVGERPIVVARDGETAIVDVPVTFDEPGQYRLTLSAAGQPRELTTKNNELSSFITVLDGGLKVLYLHGSRLGEQRYLRWSLQASPDIELDHSFFDIRQRAQWPDDRGDLLANKNYDVFVIENVPASAFTKQNLDALTTSVEAGRGLMMIGGRYSYGPGGYYNTALRDVLPIKMDRFEQQQVGPLVEMSPDLHWSDPEGQILSPIRVHPTVRLKAGDANKETWNSLPPLMGANRFIGVKESAAILLENQHGAPMLVSGAYGSGRVLAFAGDSSRLWWQRGREDVHRRFWRQCMLWLAQRDENSGSDVWLVLPNRRLPIGATLEFTCGVRAATGEPLEDAKLDVRWTKPDGETASVTVDRVEDHWGGRLRDLTDPGEHVIEVTARNGNGTRVLGTARAVMEVLDQDLELSNPAADPDRLARLARQTEDVGGAFVAAEELPPMLEKILDTPRKSSVSIQSKWRLGDRLWEAWAMFLALVALLGTEWFLRRHWGLV